MPDTLAEWICVASRRDEPISTHHLDALNLGWDPTIRGLNLLDFCLGTLEQARLHVQTLTRTAHPPRLGMYLPLGVSEAITPWAPSMWLELGDDPEPPSLYLLRDAIFFDEHDEAYQRTLDLPGSENNYFHAIYRCFRSEEHRQREWEFNLGVYII